MLKPEPHTTLARLAIILGLAAPLHFVASQARAQGEAAKDRLVVATLDEQGVPPGMGDIVADMLIRALDSPNFELLERRQVKRVLEEQAFATSDLTQPGDAVRYGKLVETRFVLIGTVYRIDGIYLVSARLVDCASGIVHERSRAVVRFRTVDEMAERIEELARSLGLRIGTAQQLPQPPAPIDATAKAVTPQPVATAQPTPVAQPITVRDYLEQVGSASDANDRVELATADRTVEVGTDIKFKVSSARDGFLSLFVVDADGRVGLLIPNPKLAQQPVRAGVAISIPSDVPFSLKAQPPLGMTRIKAIVTSSPLPLTGIGDAGVVLRRMELGEVIGSPPQVGGSPARADWSSAELEFVIVPTGGGAAATVSSVIPKPLPAVSKPISAGAAPVPSNPQTVAEARLSIAAALRIVASGEREPSLAELELLRWPLSSPLDPRIDIGWMPTVPPATPAIRIAVIDADFDPDDSGLATAFRALPVEARAELRDEIRRNGAVASRHGNRVASLVASEVAWIPSVLPGNEIVPIRITSAMEIPSYRASRGGTTELVQALRAALDAGCRVVNLSLSIALDGEERDRFARDPIWVDLNRAGVVVVCAAGNAQEDLDRTPSYPACFDLPNIICVGAIGMDGDLARWEGATGSAFGAHSVDIVAPGEWLAVSDGGGNASIGGGTSYACALVSGAAAQLIATHPQITAARAVERLIATSRPIPALFGRTRGGLLQWPSAASAGSSAQ